MTPDPAKPSPDRSDSSSTGAPTSPADSLPVYLDDEALESMEGKTVGATSGTDPDEAARLAKAESKTQQPAKAGGGGRFSYFKALVVFLCVQLLILAALGAVFRKPLSQAYNKMVDRGFIEPNSLPWQKGDGAGQASSASVGDVAWEEVRLRHELTLLADAAIARADRAAFDELRAPLESSDNPLLRAAARAEVFRVRQMYASASRLPSEPLQTEQIFPGVSTEKDLSEEQIVRLLSDPDRSSEWRIRAAHLLAGHRTLSANDALVLAVRKDPNLDVVKQAVISFKANTGYPSGDLFDADSVEKWWSENASRLASEFSGTPVVPVSTPAGTPVVSEGIPEVPAATKPQDVSAVPAGNPINEGDGPPAPRNVRPIPGPAPAVPQN